MTVTSEAPVLLGRLVRLEPLGPGHAEGVVAAVASSPAGHFGLTAVPAPDISSALVWIARNLADAQANGSMPYAIVRTGEDGDRVVGSTRFWHIERWKWGEDSPFYQRTTPDVCEIGGTWLSADSVGSGVNVEAKLLMMTLAFDTWEVHRVFWRTDARNVASRRAIEALGATLEGIRRADMVGADATVRNSAYYSMVRDEWPDSRRLLERRLTRHLAKR